MNQCRGLQSSVTFDAAFLIIMPTQGISSCMIVLIIVYYKPAASSRFRGVSDRLKNAITPSLISVAGKLYAKELIGQALNDEMINGRDIDSRKAAKLVNELQRALDNDVNPEQYLNELCTVLRGVGERQITDIVNELSKYNQIHKMY